METFVNVYTNGDGYVHYSARSAQTGATRMPHFVLVERRWNNNWLRPPVGMRGSEAGHYRGFFSGGMHLKVKYL